MFVGELSSQLANDQGIFLVIENIHLFFAWLNKAIFTRQYWYSLWKITLSVATLVNKIQIILLKTKQAIIYMEGTVKICKFILFEILKIVSWKHKCILLIVFTCKS